MITIILGMKDYLKDIWHDYIERKWAKLHKTGLSANVVQWWEWKEGNLKHYINQRRIARKYGKKKSI